MRSKGYEKLNKKKYPFKQNYIQLKEGKMHYVEEGEGEVILFIHGTPTWSFLYRNHIQKLAQSYRCIAIDHLGFGLSDKPTNFNGTPERHAENLEEFLNKKKLSNITLVVHDFGGPIGLSTAIRCSNKIKRIVLFNSWLRETKTNPNAQKINRLLNSLVGKFLYINLNFPTKFLLKKGFFDRKTLTKEIHRHYCLPFQEKSSRVHLLNLGKSLVGSSDWYQTLWNYVKKLEDKKWLILWGEKDEFIGLEYLKKWQNRFPEATLRTFEAGHFLQEECPDETIYEIEQFMRKK